MFVKVYHTPLICGHQLWVMLKSAISAINQYQAWKGRAGGHKLPQTVRSATNRSWAVAAA